MITSRKRTMSRNPFAWIPAIYWIAVLIPTIAISQLFTGNTLPDTADGIFHTHRIYAMTQLMEQGSLYPRWVPWFHLGYGYPIFNYYAPLATWLGGALGIIGVSAPLAFQLITAVSWSIGSVGITALANRFFPPVVSLVASALWVYAPTRFHEYWIQGSLSHIVATGIVPFVFLTLVVLLDAPSLRRSLHFGVAVALLLLAHQPTVFLTALYAGIIVVIWLLWQGYQKHYQQIIVAGRGLITGGILSLGLAAIFLLPLVLEIDQIVINDSPADNTSAILRANSIPFNQLFMPPIALDQTDQSATIPHTYGLLAGLLMVTGGIALVITRRFKLAVFLVGGAVISIFLMTDTSLGIWMNVPLMDQLRFPWRVSRIGIVPLALLGSASIMLLPVRWYKVGLVGVLAITIITTLPIIYPTQRNLDFANQTAINMIEYEVQSGAIGGTSYNEFKPINGDLTPVDVPEDLAVYATSPNQIMLIDPPDALERISESCWRVTEPLDQTLRFRQFYFPGWQVTLAEESLPIEASETFGLLQTYLDAKTGDRLCASYVNTTTQKVAGLISLITMLLAGGFWMSAFYVDDKPNTYTQPQLDSRFLPILGGILFTVALLNGVWIGPSTSLFRLQSPVDSPAQMTVPVHATFENAYALLGYTLHDQHAQVGQPLEITLFWHPLPGTSGTNYRLIVQFGNLTRTEAWASSELPFIGFSPYNHTPDRFISQKISLTLFEDTPAFVGEFSVWLVDTRTNERVPLAGGAGDTLILPDILSVINTSADDLPAPTPNDFANTYQIAESISLLDGGAVRQGDDIQLTLTWSLHQPIADDRVRLFIHAVDESGTIINQIDTIPFSGDYPASYWRNQPQIIETYTLSDDPNITSIAIGFYTPDTRLRIISEGEVIADGRILIPVSPLNANSEG